MLSRFQFNYFQRNISFLRKNTQHSIYIIIRIWATIRIISHYSQFVGAFSTFDAIIKIWNCTILMKTHYQQ